MTRSPAKPSRRPASKPGRPSPESFQRAGNAPPETVLLAVTGMSPAILTETIWALAHEPEPVLPSRIIVVTTIEGRRKIQQQLFDPLARFGGQAPWEALRSKLESKNFNLRGLLRFGATSDDLRVITAHDLSTGGSLELADIRTPRDNDAAADFLLEQIRAIVENPDTRLIASLAGGRKTMGALLYACMTLAGRETDRLTHVLVNEPFDFLPEFYFPEQPGEALRTRDGIAIAAREARVDLADVPFVPLRNLFARELGRKAGTFSRLVQNCRENIRQHAAENLRLSVDSTRPEIDLNGKRLQLAPREHLILLFLAVRAKQSEPAIGAYCEAVDPLNEFRGQLLEAARDPADWRRATSLQAQLDEQDIRRAISNLRDKIKNIPGDGRTLACCLPERGRFSLDMPRALIHVKNS
jgi:CRISPR-associated protein (TIGR02584 family)